MALPPERISIKRRMQDDPVETLYLEHAPARDKKRRATEFLFRRLRADEIEDIPPVPHVAGNVPNARQNKQRSSSQNDNSGIPPIRTTVPGDEVKDLKALKDAMKAQASGLKNAAYDEEEGAQQVILKENAPANVVPTRVLATARRFHLSREHDSLGPSRQHGGIRKSAHRSKTLATFVEKGLARMDQHNQTMSSATPIDRIVEVQTSAGLGEATSQISGNAKDTNNVVTKQTLDQPFVKLSTNGTKTGQSIHTHPDTWDFDSEQLASELAAFAFELDPTGDSEPPKVVSDPMAADAIIEDEFIFETYIRLPHNAELQAELEQNYLGAKLGVLVIAKEDEELWEAYAESDDDDVWDEEDADSNAEDNPANDYPEDEVSSDDELGIGSYRHRRNASDDEEYDLERDE